MHVPRNAQQDTGSRTVMFARQSFDTRLTQLRQNVLNWLGLSGVGFLGFVSDMVARNSWLGTGASVAAQQRRVASCGRLHSRWLNV